jgi:demethylmenaquinone methyltransferase/2-methoxy-6-polyprenyl-1,4-benzoquinol methylase
MTAAEQNPVELSKTSALVRAMFAQIAPRYDLLNHTLSLNIDKRWRRLTVKKLSATLSRPGAVALDLCCGTADLSLEIAKLAPTYGVDFCHEMLVLGRKKTLESGLPAVLLEGDALSVPFRDSSFDTVAIAFGLRNLVSPSRGLVEIYRLLKPGGQAAVLEFSHPSAPVLRHAYRFYFNRILPAIGRAVSGSNFAYRYLPDSVRDFPDQQELAGMMRTVGFSNVTYYNLSAGIAALHLGEK